MEYYKKKNKNDDLLNKFKEIFLDYNILLQKYDQALVNITNKMFNKSVVTPVEKKIDTVIKQNYLLYIQKYGIPKDGVFDPDLLNSFD